MQTFFAVVGHIFLILVQQVQIKCVIFLFPLGLYEVNRGHNILFYLHRKKMPSSMGGVCHINMPLQAPAQIVKNKRPSINMG